jgi:hypothetical protein
MPNKNNLSKNNILFIIFIIIFIIFVIGIIYYLYKLFNSNKFRAISKKGTEVIMTPNNSNDSILIEAKFGDLKGISGIHIHTNNNGKPGNIIAWLGTTDEWQDGVKQNTPGINAPCCNSNQKLCTLVAPKDTPYLSTLEYKKRVFSIKRCMNCEKCPWIENGTLLVIHGTHFQYDIDGIKNNMKPGIDVVEVVPLTRI